MSTQTLTDPSVRADEIDIHRERCDACGHRAYVVTEHITGAGPLPLSWCAHHFEAYTQDLIAAGGVRVQLDRRDLLGARETEVHA